MIQPRSWVLGLVGLMVTLSAVGCLPAPQREQTVAQPSTEIVISVNKGKTVVGPPAKPAPEEGEEAPSSGGDSEK